MRDRGKHAGEQRTGGAGTRDICEILVANQRTYPQLGMTDMERLKVAHRIDVDEMTRPRKAKRHHGNEALAAGEDTDVLIRQVCEQTDHLCDGLWPVMHKCSRLQTCLETVVTVAASYVRHPLSNALTQR